MRSPTGTIMWDSENKCCEYLSDKMENTATSNYSTQYWQADLFNKLVQV